MGDFSVKLKIAGTVAGRPISYQYTYTLPDVVDAVEDNDVVTGAGASRATLNTDASVLSRRGLHDYSAADFVAAYNRTVGAEPILNVFGATDQLSVPLRYGVPVVLHHSHDWDAAFLSDASTGVIDQDILNVSTAASGAPAQVNILALLKLVS